MADELTPGQYILVTTLLLWLFPALVVLIGWGMRTGFGWQTLLKSPPRPNVLQFWSVVLVFACYVALQLALGWAMVAGGLIDREALREPPNSPPAVSPELPPTITTAPASHPGSDIPLTAEQARSHARAHLLTILATLLASGFALAVARVAFRDGVTGFGLHARRLGRNVLTGAAVIAVAFPICFAVVLATNFIYHLFDAEPQVHSLFRLLDPQHPWLIVSSVVVAAIIAPIGEEIFFRGIMQSFLRRMFTVAWPPRGHWTMAFWITPPEIRLAELDAAAQGLPPTAPLPAELTNLRRLMTHLSPRQHARRALAAILVGAVLFAAVHIPVWSSLPALLVLAVALGFAYETTGSLVTVMTMHFLFNALNLLLAVGMKALGPAAGGLP